MYANLRTISDQEAREIACDSYRDEAGALREFCLNGSITAETISEAIRLTTVCGKGADFRARMRRIGSLFPYLYKHEGRGAVAFWTGGR